MGKEQGATRESVLGDDNPGIRRVGNNRMAAMEALAGGRREDIAAESGVDIPKPPPMKSDDPDAEVIDDAVIDPADPDGSKARAAKADAEARQRRSEHDAAAARESARAGAAADQLKRQMDADDRVVLDGDLSKYFVRGKVDGVEQEMPLDRAMRALQKDYAVDKRLEAATRAEKEAAAKLAAAEQSGNEAAIRKASKAKEDATENLSTTKQKIQEAAEALFAGDTASATEALLEVMQGRGDATPNVDELATAVTAKVEQQAALKAFQKNYSEIPDNPHLVAMCDARVAELMKEGKSYEDALPLAGDHVRAAIKKLAGDMGMSEGKPSTGQRVDRSSRKAEIDEPRQAGGASAHQASNPSGDGQPSASSVIAEMHRQRVGSVASVRTKPPT